MKKLSILTTALVLMSTATLAGAQAAPIVTAVNARVASLYTQVDCMERDGGPRGYCDNGPYTGPSGQDLRGRHAASDGAYRAYFNDSTPAQGNGSTNGDAQFFGIGH